METTTEVIKSLHELCGKLDGRLTELEKSIAAGEACKAGDIAAEVSSIISDMHSASDAIKNIQDSRHSVTFSELTDIIITDPSYFIKEGDWQLTHEGKDLSAVGIKLSLSGETRYGNGICNVIDESNGDILGTFASKAGMCCVAAQLDIQSYNPAALKDTDRHCFTLIKDFTGTVSFADDGRALQITGNGNINFHTEL